MFLLCWKKRKASALCLVKGRLHLPATIHHQNKRKKYIESITKKKKGARNQTSCSTKKSKTLSSTTQYLPDSPVSFCPRRTWSIPNRSFFLPPKKLWLINMAMSCGTQVPWKKNGPPCQSQGCRGQGSSHLAKVHGHPTLLQQGNHSRWLLPSVPERSPGKPRHQRWWWCCRDPFKNTDCATLKQAFFYSLYYYIIFCWQATSDTEKK